MSDAFLDAPAPERPAVPRTATDAAVLQRVLQRVAQSPEQLAAILDEEPEPLVAFTAHRSILAANEAAERFFGYGRHELVGRPTDEVVPGRFRQPDAPPQLATEDLTTVQLPSLRRDGREIATVWTYGFAPGPHGPIFVMIVLDAAEQLARQEQEIDRRFRGVFENALDGMMLVDEELRVVDANPAACRLLRRAREQVAGARVTDFMPPTRRAEAASPARVDEFRASGKATGEGEILLPDGTLRRAEYSSVAGVAPGLHLTVFRDIEDRKRAEDAHALLLRQLHAANETKDLFLRRAGHLQALASQLVRADTLADIARAFDAEDRAAPLDAHGCALFLREGDCLQLVAATPALRLAAEPWTPLPLTEETPLTRAVRTGKALWARNLDESNGHFSTAARSPLRSDVEARAAIPLVVADACVGALAVTFAAPRSFDDAERAYLTAVADLWGQALHRARLAEAERSAREAVRAELERVNRAKDEFLATMSHELRTPLNAMLGWATILRRKPRDEQRLDHGLEVIERNAKAQERLVGDLLDMSRIISGKLKLTPARTALWDVVHAAADVVRNSAESKGVRLLVDIDPELPEVIGDGARLQQVMWNLLSNAIRHTPRGGRVTVTGEQVGSEIRVTVRDTGAGIAPEHLKRIFDRFSQIDGSLTRAHGGLGLGLAIVRQLVEAHGGVVQAHSEGKGTGSTFTVVLPVPAVDTSVASGEFEAEADERADRQAGSSARPPAALPAGRTLQNVRVLVVEDERDSLDLVSHVLSVAGAEVTAVLSAREALEARGPFDVIISDVAMPEMDGYALMRRIRSQETGGAVPALALTAHVSAEDAERARRAGFQEHLRKPIEPSELLEAVDRWSRRGGAAAS